ncbi:MAG: ABC transporter substrate-binding protein [Propioniciclava sp.]
MRSPLRFLLSSVILIALLLTGCATGNPPGGTSGDAPMPRTAATRTVTDMEGRQVEVPKTIESVVSIGSVPVINSLIFALGRGELIANTLPEWASSAGQWKYQYVFAPQITDAPLVQGADGPLTEKLLEMDPDVILTMEKAMIEPLEAVGLTVVVISVTSSLEMKNQINLLGEILDAPERAADYIEWYDDAVSRLADKVAAASADQRSALYLGHEGMRRPNIVSEWWIPAAGGLSVTADRTEQRLTFDSEQLIGWDPDVIFLISAGEVETVLADPQLQTMTAVKNEEVYVTPIAAHPWGNRTTEQPLTAFWAATKLYPDAVSYADLRAEAEHFYANIYRVDLTDEQLDEIVSGRR